MELEVVIRILAALGAWLLVAGPIYQSAIELREEAEGFGRDELQTGVDQLPPPPQISPWWWLLPPVALIKRRRASSEYRRRVFDSFTVEQRTRYVGFTNKATAWLTVAGGALLIAAKETWELLHMLHWTEWLLVPFILVPLIASVANTAVRIARGERMIHPEGSTGRGR